MWKLGTLAACLVLVPTALLLAEPDPWRLPRTNGLKMMVVVTTSEKNYNIFLDDEFPDDVPDPDHVEIVHKGRDARSLAKCREHLAEGKPAKAQKIAAAVMRRNKGDHDASMLRAKSFLDLGKAEDALTFIRKSIIGNRRNPEAWKLLEEIAEWLGKKVVHPRLKPQGWLRPPHPNGEVDFGYMNFEVTGDFPWNFYAAARAVYRHEGRYEKDFPDAEGYRFTFREQLYAAGAAVRDSEEKDGKVTEGLKRLLAEKEKGTIVPFLFFAMYPEAVPEKPEKHFDELLPILTKYFDEHILVDP